MTRHDAIVVGGGLAGLSCALALARHGIAPLVLESESRLGGRAQSHRDEATGDIVDIGPHVLLDLYANFLALLELVGTRDRICWQRQPLMTVVDAGRHVELTTHRGPPPLGLAGGLWRVPVSWRELATNLGVTIEAFRLDDTEVLAFDDVAASAYLARRNVAPRVVDWFWRSFAMWLLNTPLERCSTAALLRLFRQLAGSVAPRIGVANEGLADTYLPHVPDAILAAGGEVRTGAAVAALESAGDDGIAVRCADGSLRVAPDVVATVPPDTLATLVPDAWRAREPALAALDRFEPCAYVSTYLWLDRRIGPLRWWAHAWHERQLHYDFYELTNIRRGWAARPGSVVGCNLIDAERARGLDDAAIVAAAQAEIAEAVPAAAAARVVHASVHRIPLAIPRPTPGTERARPAARTAIAGLHLAGDWTRTDLPCSMESAVRSGFLAAESVLARRGIAASIAKPPPAPHGLVGLLQRSGRPTTGLGRG